MFLILILSFITLLFYFLERLLFLFWNWSFFQNQPTSDILLAFLHGIRFDMAAISLLATIPLLMAIAGSFSKKLNNSTYFNKVIVGLFLIFQFPTMILNLGDVEFVNFMGRRYTLDALFFMKEIPGKFWAMVFYYWPLSLVSSLLLIGYAAAILFSPLRFKEPAPALGRKILSAVLILILFVVGGRGGLQEKPINFVHAQVFLNPSMNNLVLNSSFTFLQTIRRQSLPRDQFYSSPEEMLKWVNYGQAQRSAESQISQPSAGKPNVVLIILESFAYEYLGYPNGGKGFTPFLDELAKDSLFFTNSYANARRSIEGIGAIMGGVPALMNEPFISSQYLTNYFLGLGTVLQNQGYSTSFFHGANNGTMYFDQFMKSAGMQSYFGKNQYPKSEDYDGTWGIWDEPFLSWMNDQLDQQKPPFFSTVFTLSSHNPFRIPDKYRGKFPKGDLDIHESIGYTDYALREFFAKARTRSWFANTIFVITADHTYKSSRPEYDNEIGKYRVPLIIYSPKIQLPKVEQDQVVQQVDLMPTILEVAGVNLKEKNFLGHSVFNSGDRYAINYVDNRYLFITKDYFLEYRRSADSLAQFQLFSISDPGQKKPILDQNEIKQTMVNRLKGVLQYFSQGLWDNKLYYPSVGK